MRTDAGEVLIRTQAKAYRAPDFAGITITTRPDGSVVRLRKLHADYDPGDRIRAMSYVQEHTTRGEVVTGMLYLDNDAADLHQQLDTVKPPLNSLGAAELCPGSAALEKINASLR